MVSSAAERLRRAQTHHGIDTLHDGRVQGVDIVRRDVDDGLAGSLGVEPFVGAEVGLGVGNMDNCSEASVLVLDRVASERENAPALIHWENSLALTSTKLLSGCSQN